MTPLPPLQKERRKWESASFDIKTTKNPESEEYNMKARLPQGYGGGPSNMQGMIKQAQKMQEQMTNLQAELDEKEYDFTVGGGMLTIHMNGKKEMLGIEIKPEVVDPDDIEMLQDLIVAGVNEAISTIEKTNADAMNAITGSLNIPGMF